MKDNGEQLRKRKRRRRSKAGHGTPPLANAQSSAGEAVSGGTVESGSHRQASRQRAGSGPGNGPHQGKKRRNRRGLQGRPLANGEKPQAAPQSERPKAAPSVTVAEDRKPHAQTGFEGWRNAVSPGPSFVSSNTQGSHHTADISAPLYAALDLGTNNCRLLIAQPTRPGQFRVVDAFSRIVRLGEGLGASGRLSPEAMDRSIEALKICAAKLEDARYSPQPADCDRSRRAADNGEDFLERVLSETGLELEIINRETEARLAVSGCSSLVGRETKSVVLFDIGGGSSEIAVIKIGENRVAAGWPTTSPTGPRCRSAS